jgi:alkanesulfonate monooxygenase SsuD/methylene tetrahydromethanopterin reductase-like flavin-dependent oxidoreductase (luciferase family)
MRLKIATGICLVIQRDTIQTAKLVASLDHVSGGRFLIRPGLPFGPVQPS